MVVEEAEPVGSAGTFRSRFESGIGRRADAGA